MMVKKMVFSLIASISMSSVSATQIDPVTSSVVVTKGQTKFSTYTGTKEVFLMPVKLTKKQLAAFYKTKSLSSPTKLMQPLDLPSHVQRGMNNVPVLDQGRHGSCVTFAVTAAIDALIGKGDYISQLCSLELGTYLEKEGYYPSGWNGSLDHIVLNQIEEFGFVNKQKQLEGLCAGVKEYPINDENNEGKSINLETYKPLSETLDTSNTFFISDPLLTIMQRFESDSETKKALMGVKKFLASKDTRINTGLVFGVLLPVRYCSAGACGTFRKKDDTWALTDAMKNDDHLEFGGHEMIITGYDDQAVAVDHEGKKHYGLLTLRNSWGDDVGDSGNYYMTYDFFKSFVLDVEKLYFANDLLN